MTNISKSRYLKGVQCIKLLWYDANKREAFPEVDAATQAKFDTGHDVGDYAKAIFPNGVEVKYELPFKAKVGLTQKLLEKRKVIFEAVISTNSLYSQPDILIPVNGGMWDICEVKSSTKDKEINWWDIAFQKYVYELKGLKVRKCFMLVINNQYVRKGKIEPRKLLKKIDVTEEVEKLLPKAKELVDEFHSIISLPKSPTVRIGSQCNSPYECPLISICWDFLPPHNVTEIYRLNTDKAAELIYDGSIISIKDLPDDYKLSESQKIQVEAEKTNTPYVAKKSIKNFIETLEYPLQFLDFESMNPGIPLFDGTRPYQQIPFQFSLHIQETPESELKHISVIGSDDPRKEVVEGLIDNLLDSGSIIVYNQTFEKHILMDLARWFPKHEKKLLSMIKQVKDLIIPFRKFEYYHPEQKGSCSIKAVLPVLTGITYDDMDIHNGDMARLEYMRVMDAPAKEKKKIYDQLEEYCTLDTLAMVEILKKLKVLVL